MPGIRRLALISIILEFVVRPVTGRCIKKIEIHGDKAAEQLVLYTSTEI